MMNFKKCTLCSETKPLEDFGKNKVYSSGYPNQCKACRSIGGKVRKAEKTEFLRFVKQEQGCVDCGYAEHPAALQFDHVADDKEHHPADLCGQGWGVLLKEIQKCEVVCANCHSVRTYDRREEAL